MIQPLIAIVGRPNVGKSTLFNRLVGGRPALVHDTPGLTRDRRYGECDYFGAEMRVVDTGGLTPRPPVTSSAPASIARRCVRSARRTRSSWWSTARAGLSAIDQGLATQLRATGKPVFLAVNKIDHPTRDDLVHDFHGLGLGAPYAVSAAHGRGIDPLLEAIAEAVGAQRPDVPDTDPEDIWDVLDGHVPEPADGADGDAPEDPAHAAALAHRAEVDARPLRVAFRRPAPMPASRR